MHGPDARVDGPRTTVRGRWLGLAVVVVMVSSLVATVAGHAQTPDATARAASVCADFATQADAQRAADTRDADSDGVYCESLPCPCSTGGEGSTSPAPTPAPSPAPNIGCSRPTQVQRIGFSKTKYRHIRRHYLATLAKGWPRILVLNRPQAAERRERLLEGIPTRDGFDRDEYPPAVGRGRGHGLVRGSDPKGWRAEVAYVGSHENRSHGARLGIKLRRFCDGTKFRYVFY